METIEEAAYGVQVKFQNGEFTRTPLLREQVIGEIKEALDKSGSDPVYFRVHTCTRSQYSIYRRTWDSPSGSMKVGSVPKTTANYEILSEMIGQFRSGGSLTQEGVR